MFIVQISAWQNILKNVLAKVRIIRTIQYNRKVKKVKDKPGPDADELVNMKMSQNEEKYPVDKAKGTAAKYTELS